MLLGFMPLIVVTQILAKLIRSQTKLSGQATDALKGTKIQSYPKMNIREFKIYDSTVAKTSLKIASSSFSVYFAIMSVCLTFES